jgi:hypothetical protein
MLQIKGLLEFLQLAFGLYSLLCWLSQFQDVCANPTLWVKLIMEDKRSKFTQSIQSFGKLSRNWQRFA